MAAMRLLTGTSGFSYKPWKGPFYPEDLPDRDMLRFYAERLFSPQWRAHWSLRWRDVRESAKKVDKQYKETLYGTKPLQPTQAPWL
jgi:hypothetical protein